MDDRKKNKRAGYLDRHLRDVAGGLVLDVARDLEVCTLSAVAERLEVSRDRLYRILDDCDLRAEWDRIRRAAPRRALPRNTATVA